MLNLALWVGVLALFASGAIATALWLQRRRQIRNQELEDITERGRQELALRESEERYHKLFANEHTIMLLIDPANARIVDASPAACAFYGHPATRLRGGEVALLGTLYSQGRTLDFATLGADNEYFHEGRQRLADGRARDVEIHHVPIRLAERDLLFCIVHDVTQRKRAEETVRLAATVFEFTRDGVVITDLVPRILAVNRAFTQITGYPESDVIGQNPSLISSGTQDAAYYEDMWASLRELGHWQGEIWNRRKNGEVYPEWLSISVVPDDRGNPANYVGVFTDISQLKQSEARLESLAHYDTLTGLPNRRLVQSRLEQALARAKRRGERVSVLFIDLDRFKTINDSLGHPVGDELLIAIGKRLTERLRREDTLARLGGDEFLLIIESLALPADAAVVAQEMIGLLKKPFLLAGRHEVYVGASVGISLFPDDGLDVTTLIQHADAAMYQAKEEGRDTYRFYTRALTESANWRLDLETRLRQALEREEFVLHYQPIISAEDGGLLGFEALVRWQPEGLAMVPPADFVPVCEETGLIIPLGFWVLRTACTQARGWLDAGPRPVRLAVNLSLRQLRFQDLVRQVHETLESTGFPAELLQLELTESSIMEQGEQAVAALRELKALGVRLAIDDFGTGYSSLAHLKRFHVDRLKVDRSFVQNLVKDGSDQQIAATIIDMAHNLRLDVVAEGVEHPDQRDWLTAMGCDAFQGFLFGRPVSAEAAWEWVRSGAPANPDQGEDSTSV